MKKISPNKNVSARAQCVELASHIIRVNKNVPSLSLSLSSNVASISTHLHLTWEIPEFSQIHQLQPFLPIHPGAPEPQFVQYHAKKPRLTMKNEEKIYGVLGVCVVSREQQNFVRWVKTFFFHVQLNTLLHHYCPQINHHSIAHIFTNVFPLELPFNSIALTDDNRLKT